MAKLIIRRLLVNKHVINRNRTTGERQPPLAAKEGRKTEYGSSFVIDGPCRLIYRPDNPLACGASVWLETYSSVFKEE